MARQRTSLFEDIILAASKLPWWACILLAAVSDVILDYIASRPFPDIAGDPMRIADVIAPALVSNMAFFGKIILPIAFGFAGIASAINAYRQKNCTPMSSRGHERQRCRPCPGRSSSGLWRSTSVGKAFL